MVKKKEKKRKKVTKGGRANIISAQPVVKLDSETELNDNEETPNTRIHDFSQTKTKRGRSLSWRTRKDKSRSPSAGKSQEREKNEYEEKDGFKWAPNLTGRESLGRMTVREALIDSKVRGRSPHRNMFRLEKVVLDKEPRGSLSMPDIAHVDTKEDIADTEDNGDRIQTLPSQYRSRSRRQTKHIRKEGIGSNIAITESVVSSFSSNHSDIVDSFPLDKRKYMITQEPAACPEPTSQPCGGTKDHVPRSATVHSSPSDNSIKSRHDRSPSFIESETQRRQSFTVFLQLSKTMPPFSSSSRSNSLSRERRTSQYYSIVNSMNEPNISEGQINEVPGTVAVTTGDRSDGGDQVHHQTNAFHDNAGSSIHNMTNDFKSTNLKKEAETKSNMLSSLSKRNKNSGMPRNEIRHCDTEPDAYELPKTKSSESPLDKENTQEQNSSMFGKTLHVDHKQHEASRSSPALKTMDLLEAAENLETVRRSSDTPAPKRTKYRRSFRKAGDFRDKVVNHPIKDSHELGKSVNKITVDAVLADSKEKQKPSIIGSIVENEVSSQVCATLSSRVEIHEPPKWIAVEDVDAQNEKIIVQTSPQLQTRNADDDIRSKYTIAETQTSSAQRPQMLLSKTDETQAGNVQHWGALSTTDHYDNVPMTRSRSLIRHRDKKSLGLIDHHTDVSMKRSRSLIRHRDKKTLGSVDQRSVPLNRSKSLIRHKDKKDKERMKRNSLLPGSPKNKSSDDILLATNTEPMLIPTRELQRCKSETSLKGVVKSEVKEDTAKIKSEKQKPKEAGQASSTLPTPKLSLAAIVSLKSKLARWRKQKQEKKEAEKQGVKETELDYNKEGDLNAWFIENELNFSFNKLAALKETAIIRDDFTDSKDSLFEKRSIRFHSVSVDDSIDLSEDELIRQRQTNTRLTRRRESKIRRRQREVLTCCKKFVAFLFSHIGLCSLVVAYCIAGGFIFQELEGGYEREMQFKNKMERESLVTAMWDKAFEIHLSKLSREQFRTEVDEMLLNYSRKIQRATKEFGWNGKDESGGTSEKWSFPSSMLYAITVMTTIGYGHVAPKTDYGRIVTIAYAVLGIPLTLLCLTNIGDVMAHGFRMLYGKVCCGLCCILFRPSRRRLPDPEKGISMEEERIVMQEEEKIEEVIHVPTSLCIILMASYVLLGTVMFGEWEGWDFITGTYFCFITLSTIGFGDVVPGTDATTWDMEEKLVLCSMYLIFGLSLIAMCFNLVQEDVKAKFRWLGMKIGIIDEPVSSV